MAQLRHGLRGGMVLATMLALAASAAVTVSPQEMAQKDQWVQQNLLTASNLPPFSFSYGGVSSTRILPVWKRTEADTTLDSNRVQHVITWSNDAVQLQCVAVDYSDYPMVEWTVYIKDMSLSTTALWQGIQGLDMTFLRTNGPEFVLNGNQGDFTTADSYEPFQLTLTPSFTTNFSPPSYSGKSCDGPTGWPYYNLQVPGGGMILAIGWPGQWASSFTRDAADGLQIQAGQQLTHLVLEPGETIRTPLIALLFWQGTNLVRAQNIWRHWYLAHEIPRVTGQPPATVTPVGGNTVGVAESYLDAGIEPDFLWQDAGWYPCNEGPYTGANSWLNTGTWVVDTNQYPAGFGPSSAQLHELGIKFLLWFEPERIGNPNSWLATNHPQWLLPGTSTTVGDILNEGNPAVFDWLTNHINCLIQSNGVDWYREDMNGGGPLPTWQNNDATNRQGITENFYVQNHLAYWDALLAMNPGLRIDCCGSGGRRNDLEAMQRAVPLTRSDFEAADLPDVVDGNQCQTYGLSSWLPFQGTGCYVYDPYSFRSFYMASFIMGAGLTPENTAAQQQAYAECKRVAPILLNGDYYPLTPYSLTNTVWMAWQFDWPDTGQGVVQVFRRTNSPVPSMVFTLQGLNPTQQYAVQDFDKGNLGWHSGLDLMSNGLSVQLNPEQSAILYYTNAHGVILSATANPASGFAPLAVQFDATGLSASGAPVSYRWNFGDGGTSTNQNPIYTYETAGRYVAELTAGDGQGDTNTVGVSVTVASVAGQIMNINFSGYTESEPLTNFPALVILGTNLSTNGFSYSQVASSNGWDLLFLNSNKTQLLNYEIEKWDANGDSYVWVQVPLLASNSCIWASWGNARLASMPSASTQNGSVWTNGYAGVWHLANGSVLSATDSTTNDNDGIIYNATPVEGVIDGAGQFNGEDSYVDLGTPTNARAYQQVTMSAWVYPIGGTVVLMAGNDDTPQSYGLEWSGNSSLLFSFANTTDWLGDGGFTPPNQWSFVTGVINGNTKLLYVDGILRASKTFAGILSGNPLSLWLGAQNRPSYNYWFEGILDEARISSMARSSNWIGAEYMTVASNQTVNAYGAVTSYNPPTLSLVSWTTGGNGIGLVLSWPTNVVGLELQMSRDLVHWTNSTATVTLSDTDYTVTVTNESTAQFYRLAGY